MGRTMPATSDSAEIDLVRAAGTEAIGVSSRSAVFQRPPTETFGRSLWLSKSGSSDGERRGEHGVKVRSLEQEPPAARLGQKYGNGESTCIIGIQFHIVLNPTMDTDALDIDEWWENKDLDVTMHRHRGIDAQRFNQCGRERKRDGNNENEERYDGRTF